MNLQTSIEAKPSISATPLVWYYGWTTIKLLMRSHSYATIIVPTDCATHHIRKIGVPIKPSKTSTASVPFEAGSFNANDLAFKIANLGFWLRRSALIKHAPNCNALARGSQSSFSTHPQTKKATAVSSSASVSR